MINSKFNVKVLNVAMELPKGRHSYRVKTKHIMADDSASYNIRYNFEEAFRFIDDATARGGRVLVHCAMGISRSATIVIAYLMYKYRVPLATAYNFVKARRPEINPNPGFMNALQQYEYELSYQNGGGVNGYARASQPQQQYYAAYDQYGY
jgi:atypical dual specificity phosphatase